MPSDDRDQQLERALARHLHSASPDEACPDAEILAAYHERSLSLEEMAHWKTHIASCSRCQETLALLEQTDSVAANDWEKHELPAALRGVEGIEKEEDAPAKFAATAATVPVVVPSGTKAAAKTRRRVPWSIIVPAGTLAASLLVWVVVHESPQFSREGKASVQVAENRETSPPASKETPETGKAQARDEGFAALQSKNPAERAPAAPGTTPAQPAKEMPSTHLVAPPPARQDLAKSEQDKFAQLDASRSADEFRARDAEVIVGGRRAAIAAPAVPKAAAGQAGGPLVANQAQNQMQNQIANQYSNQAPTPPANRPVSQASEPVKVEAEKQPAAKDKKDAQRALKQKNETVAVGAASETVEVTSAPPAPTAGAFSRASINDRAVFLLQLQDRNIIVSPDQKHVWRIGPAGAIESSTDVGKTWKTQTSGVTADLLSGSSPSEKVCWIVGKNGTLLLTKDGGKHWKQLISPISEDIGGVQAMDAQAASIWDLPNRNRFETSDGGRTWKQVANQ